MTTQLEPEEATPGRRRAKALYAVPVVLIVALVAAAVAAADIATSKGSLRTGVDSLAVLSLPRGGGSVTRVVAVGGPERQVVAVRMKGQNVIPVGQLDQGERVSLEVTIKRPGWISWLSGQYEHLKLSVTTPTARLGSAFLTRRSGQPLAVAFTTPVARAGYGPLGAHLTVSDLTAPQRSLTLTESAAAGTATVSFAPRTWERPTFTNVSWFPAGTHATAIASPGVGSTIEPDSKITLTFSKPLSRVLKAGALPRLSPQTSGAWHKLNARTIEFVPRGYGYGLAATVTVALPAGVTLAGAQQKSASTVATWNVPGGSTLGLQELLSRLGYLPVEFKPSSPSKPAQDASPEAQEAVAVDPPAGKFSWRYPHTPALLKALWSPTKFTELTKGAVMAFEESQGMTPDGVAGPAVWKALINAEVKDQASNFGYTFVMVSEKLPENIRVWHNGHIVVHGLVNTGIPASPTATGTYAVYEHLPSGTMSGTNPDGTTYHDPGIPWISYFNGGDALHGFIRASYGFQQSLGCVEMPFARAGAVYPYTPIGTIVNLTPA